MKNVSPARMPEWLKPGRIIFIAIAVLFLIMLFSSFYMVDASEEAIITRFGKYHRSMGPGLHIKFPFGIDRDYKVNIRAVMTEQFGFRPLKSGKSITYYEGAIPEESSMLTGDLNMVEVEWIIQYRIADPMAWLFNVHEQEATIQDVSRSVINMLIGDRAIMDIMGNQRSIIESEGMTYMNETFRDYGLGIDVIAVKLQNVDPPTGVQDAFDDVNKAEQDKNRLINEGQESYNKEIPRAKGEAERMLQMAQGYAAERVNRARGDVNRFNLVYNEYQKSKDVTRKRLYYEMIEEVFRDDPGTTLIDKNLENFLPLKNLDGGR